jgi:hypothetical protein
MSMRRVVAYLGAIAAIGGIAVGCSTPERGNPTPHLTQTSSSTAPSTSGSGDPAPSLPFAGAPKVANPIEAKRFVDDPCLALTSEQVKQLKVGPGKKDSSAFGMACQWPGLELSGSLIDLSFNTRTRDGLSAIYRSNAEDKDKYAKFEPVPDVEGFPAVVAMPPNYPNGTCNMFVGLSDEVAFQLGVQQSAQKVGTVDPC